MILSNAQQYSVMISKLNVTGSKVKISPCFLGQNSKITPVLDQNYPHVYWVKIQNFPLFIGSKFEIFCKLNFVFEYVVLNIFIVVGQLALCWKVELASLTSDVHFQVKAFLNAVTTH